MTPEEAQELQQEYITSFSQIIYNNPPSQDLVSL